MEAEVGHRLQARLSRMTHHRDFVGEYDWIAVDCDRKGAPMPAFVHPEWPATHTLGALADAAQWLLDN